MRWLARIAFSVKSLFWKKKLEEQLSDEIRIHFEMAIEANISAGMAPDEARYAALRGFGNVATIQQQARDERGWLWLELWGKDLGFAARSLRQNPGFAIVVILTLALGIGANTAVFTAIDGLMLRTLPIKDPDRFVLVAAAGATRPNQDFPYPLFEKGESNKAFPYPFYELFRDQSRTLSDVVATAGWVMSRPMVATGIGAKDVESVEAEEVTGNYFSALGISAVLGRTLDSADDRNGKAEPVVVISFDFWQHRFGADPAVIGKTLRLDNVTVTIVGVLPRGFGGVQVGLKPNLWFPMQLSPRVDGNLPWGSGAMQSGTLPWIHILGRLSAGASRQQAAAELDVIYQRKLAQMDPRRVRNPSDPARANLLEQKIEVAPAGTGYGGVRPSYAKPVFVLMMMVGVMQLIACANVAGLLLARGAARQPELALRSALGASRGRLVRQLLTESLLLAVLAGLLGLLLAEGSTHVLASYVGGIELWADWHVLVFALTATIVTGIIFGLVPALRLSRRELTRSLKLPNPAGRQRLNFALVITQIAFAFYLLAIAGLFTRTLQNLISVDTGFQRRDRLLFDLNVGPDFKPEQRSALYRQLLAGVAALPGVDNVTVYQGVDLLGDMAFQLLFSVRGYVPVRDEVLTASLALVGPRFFETMGIPLLRGRDFGLHDEETKSHGVPALVLSEWSAHRLFGEADPIGKRISMYGDYEIVGVAKNVRYGALREAPRFVFYVPFIHQPNTLRMTFAVKTGGASATLVPSLRTLVRQLDAQAQMSGIRTVAEKVDQALSPDRLIAHLTGFFGGCALSLAGMGLFGLMSYNVNRRTREIGIRMALGAPIRRILLMVARQGCTLGLVGCGVGLGGAFVLTRFVSSLLYGVPSVDLPTFAASAVALLGVTFLASVIPARRAAWVNPVVALRAE